MARDSHSTKPLSSSVGTQCCGFMATYHGWSCSLSNKLTLMTWKIECTIVDYGVRMEVRNVFAYKNDKLYGTFLHVMNYNKAGNSMVDRLPRHLVPDSLWSTRRHVMVVMVHNDSIWAYSLFLLQVMLWNLLAGRKVKAIITYLTDTHPLHVME